MILSTLAFLALAPTIGALEEESSTFFRAENVPVPTTEADKHSNIGTSMITIGDKEYETSYITFLRTGDEVNGVIFGQNFDQNMEPILQYPQDKKYAELPLYNEPTDQEVISTVLDFTSFLKANENSVTPFAMFAHFESPRPSISYRINVDFTNDCKLDVKSIEAMDWSEWGGLWTPCSGSVTSWNTHLGSEEHEPDARLLTLTYDEFVEAYNSGFKSAKNIMQFIRYWGYYTDVPNKSMDELREIFNPYLYGHATEMSVDDNGETQVSKWYTVGRLAYEIAEVMPDDKTVYATDDGTNGIFVAFVMDTERDLSSGTLYISKWEQTSDENGGEFDISWIELGSATQDELVDIVEDLTFDKIFDVADPTPTAAEKVADGSDPTYSCPEGFTSINAGHDTAKHECLKVKEGMEKAAAFFETRRYGAMLGGTTELKSMEGLAAVESTMKLYASMSSISLGMEDNKAKGVDETKYDVGGPNHVRLPYNKCGCVYEMDMETTSGWMEITKARALVCGDPDDTDSDNSCSVDSIANPDNLAYMGRFGSGIHSLLIAEDTSSHQNDYLWAYDFGTGEMTRMLTSVYGSQVTGPGFFNDGMGCHLLMTVLPHPYKKSDQEKVKDTDNMGLAGNIGYIGPIGSRI